MDFKKEIIICNKLYKIQYKVLLITNYETQMIDSNLKQER
jgi:hypothetical protein